MPKNMRNASPSRAGRSRRLSTLALTGLLTTTCLYGTARAEMLQDSDNYRIIWDNTVKYSVAVRTSAPSDDITGAVPTSTGDGSFNQWGLTTDRFDLTSKFSLTTKDEHHYGLDLSGDAWYDTVYMGSHNTVGGSSGIDSVAGDQFSSTAQRIDGRNARLGDAAVRGTWQIGQHDFSLRLGRQTMLWGESLFASNNGIAYGMAPVDAVKAASVPNSQAKELYLPVTQATASFALNDEFTLQGYYQLEYRADQVSAPGAYFSPSDAVYEGAERLYVAPGVYFNHGADQNPANTHGQFGVALTYSNPDIDFDGGLYYVHYTDKLPQEYIYGAGGSYYFVYPKNIEIFGVSGSTTIGQANVGGEISLRHNTPLISNATSLVATSANETDALYAKGNTLNFQASMVDVLPPTRFYDTAPLVTEIYGHHIVSITHDASALNSHVAETALAIQGVFQPTWYQVRPDLDLSMPLGLADILLGPSPEDVSFAGTGARRGGYVTIGLNGVYRSVWTVALTYQRFLGSPSGYATDGSQTGNSFADRDNLSFSVSRTF